MVLLLLRCAAGFVPPNPSRASSAPTVARKGKSISSGENRRSSPLLQGAESIIMASSSGDTAAAADLEIKSETACFGGRLLKCVHQSKATKTPMTFTVFLPPAAASSGVPVGIYIQSAEQYLGTKHVWYFGTAVADQSIVCTYMHGVCSYAVVASKFVCCRCLEMLLPSAYALSVSSGDRYLMCTLVQTTAVQRSCAEANVEL